MRTATISVAIILASLLAADGANAAGYGQYRSDSEEMRARDEFRQSYTLSTHATVRVRGIAGPVTVETGGDRAEVHIIRMAASERELQCYRTGVSASRDGLLIEHVQDRDRPGCRNIHSRQEVRLVLPRSVNLELSSIAGNVEVGALDGTIRLESIAGRAALAQARSADIESVAGSLTIGLASIAPDGVRISSVAGPVEISFGRDVDADIRVDSVVGSVRSLSADLDLSERDGIWRGRTGAGGRRVSLSSIVGPVRLRRP